MMAYDSSNIFARVLREEIPCNKVLEDDFGLAFHDLHPKAPVHVLVIPKGAYENAWDFSVHASDKEIIGFQRFLGKVIDKLQVAQQGYRLIANHGRHGGQEVPHYHIHILGGASLGPMVIKE